MSTSEHWAHATLGQAAEALRFQSVVTSLMFHFTEPRQHYANKAVQILVEWVRSQDRSLLTDSGYVSVMEALRQAEVAYPAAVTQETKEE